MKWLKKNSSNNEQISIAESQPEPEHPSVDNPDEIYAPELETLEQPETESVQISSKQNNAYETELDETEPVKSIKTSGRRRERSSQNSTSDKKQTNTRFSSLKHSWVGQHWKTLAILMAIFCLGFFARAYYGLQPATEDGFILSGGSDSYYHNYVITHADETGQHHFWDNMLNYPVGTRNPRPPLYDWSVSLMGIGLSPFFDGDIFSSTMYMLLFSTAFWGALTIFPTYFLGKEAFGKKAGIIAAFLLAIMPGHIQRSVLTNADHDAITLFFIVTAFFFFLKSLKIMEKKEWINTWKPKVVYDGTKSFVISNKISILYSVLAGFSIAGVALIWQGFAYVIVLVSVYFLFQIIINRFRNVDSLGVTILYFITVGTGLLVAFPYYYQSIQIASWFDTPSILFFALFAFGVFLILTRKLPWFLVFSSMILLSVLMVFILKIFAPSILDTIVNALLSGGGYFINNKQYQTIAEAQAPPFSNLALSFGIFTFWLSFVGLAWAAIQLPKSWAPDLTLMLLWSGSAIYMAVTAARFMFNAGPAFAITGGWIIAIIIGKIDFKKYTDSLKRTSKPNMTYAFKLGLLASIAIVIILSLVLSSISNTAYPVFVIGFSLICGIYTLNLIAETNPNRIYNLLTIMIPASGAIFYILAEFYTDWVISDATHLFILAILLFSYFVLYMQVRRTSFFFTMGIIFLTFCIIVPNVWAGLDAGIPYESKTDYDKEIYNSMPIFMQPADYDVANGTNWYLGGFGYSLPLNTRYWPAAYDWLATQDTDIYPTYERPAFISWWDYGFEIVNEGQHPTVADNFLGGHQLAGNFIMAQSESDAIALLCTRLLEGNWQGPTDNRRASFDSKVTALLNQYGLDSAELGHIFTTPSDYVKEILDHPEIYGPRDESIQDPNAAYIVCRVLFTKTLDENQIVNFYKDLCTITGDSIRYFGIDSRLFPFSADSTGIFYAPAKLSDHRIDETANQPYDFWEIKAVGEFGGEYELDEIPPDVNLNPDTPYKIVYKDMFYNSMLYKAFVGYSGSDIGSEEGIPGLTESLSSNPIMPGWNMTHFKLEYRTAYWNPYSAKDIQNHTDAWQAMNYWDAYAKQQAGEGISDLSDRSSLYQGVMMLKYYHGAIISGKVTLEDGTPIEGVSVTVSDDFDIPHQQVTTDIDGSYSIIAPYGNITLTVSKGALDPLTLKGTELNVTKMYIGDYQAMRENEDRDNNGVPDYLLNQNLIISSGGVSGYVFWDLNADGTLGSAEEKIPYAKIALSNNESAYSTSMFADYSGKFNFEKLPPGSYSIQVSSANRTIGTLGLSVAGKQSSENNLAIPVTVLSGTVKFSDGTPASGATVSFWMSEENIEVAALTDTNGTYSFSNILFGNFSAQASIYGQYASTIQRTHISQSVNNTVDFVLYDSMKLEGTVYLNGVPVPYVTIKFAGASDSIVTTTASGTYSIILNDGDYTYYINHMKNGGTYAILDMVYLDDDQTLDIDLKPACMVNGNVINNKGGKAIYTQVVFDSLDSNLYISAMTDYLGDYSIIIPQGNYRIQVSSNIAGSYYGFQTFTSKQQTFNIAAKEGTTVSGTIFWDLISNGAIDPKEGLENVGILFQDSSGNYAQAITNDTGTFSIILPPTTLYTITITKAGFYSVNLGTYTPADLKKGIIQSMEPLFVPITGSIYLGDNILKDQSIIVKLTSNYDAIPSSEFQVGNDGRFSGMLIPGLYIVSFTHNLTTGNDSVVYQIDEELSMDTGLYTGTILNLELTAVKRSKVTISLENSLELGANISFRNGPEDRFFDMESMVESFYVMPGEYLLSASHSSNATFFVDMQDVTVFNISNNYSINFKEGITVTGSLQYNGESISQQKVTFSDTHTNGTLSVYTDDSGTYKAILVPNVKYEITADFIGYDEIPYLRAYRYYSRGTIIDTTADTLPNQQINLIRENYSINLDGVVNLGDDFAPNTELTFISDFGNFTAITNAAGNFSVALPPAQYLLYAYQSTSRYAYFAKIMIEIEQEKLSINLIKGNRIYGTAYYDLNKNTQTTITFASEDGRNITTRSNEEGFYEFVLPSGKYNITSKIITLKNEMDVTYSLNLDVELQTDRQINLPLSMIEQRIVFVSYNPSQLIETMDNTTVQYTFEVENTGNIRDTYDISASGGNPDWTIELSTSEITLDPGVNNKATISVIAGIPAGAKIDQNKITLTAISRKDISIRHNTVINVPIHQNYKLSIQPTTTSPKFTKGNISSDFSVLNTGNGADKFTFYIANNADLILNGWTVKLGTLQGSEVQNDGKMIVNVSTGSGTSSKIPILLSPANSNPSRQVSVLIVGYSQNDENAISSNYIILKYPELQLSSANVTITGNVVSETVSGDQLTNAGVMVISVASALIIFYYARKKRWIR